LVSQKTPSIFAAPNTGNVLLKAGQIGEKINEDLFAYVKRNPLSLHPL